MAFALVSNISIGKYTGVKPHEVKINKSMFEFVDKAMIKLPITARIVRNGEPITQSAETAKLIDEGDVVRIDLGYNGSLKTEFTGFVSRVNLTAPIEVECEGYSYQLRKKTYLRTFKKAKLLSILKYLVEGTDIKLDESYIPKFEIEKMVLQKNNGVEALEMIKKISDNTIRIFFNGNTMYAGLQFTRPFANVRYRLGWNVIKDSELKLRQAKNQDVVVHYIGEKKDGSKVKVKTDARSGKTGEEKIIKTHSVIDESSLKQMADAKLKWLSFDGYEGKIKAFLEPFCQPGWKAIIEDKKYKERSGNYIAESVEVTYGMSGARRTIGIGAKL